MINHKEASKKVGVNERTLTRLVLEREIQRIKQGREILYNDDDIIKLQAVVNKDRKADELTNKMYMVGSPKGGTAKTTTIKYLSSMLAKKGSVLVVDADPQHYFTDFAINYVSGENRQKLRDYNLLTLLKEDKKLVKCSMPVFQNIDFIPGLRSLEHYDRELANVMGRELRLKKVLSPALPRYDFVLIDTSPAQSGITIAALMAAHVLIVPVIPDVDSLEAAKDLLKSVDKIMKDDLSDKFRLSEIYILPVKQKTGLRAGFSKQVLRDIRTGFADVENILNMQIEVLDPILDYDYIPRESYEGVLKTDTRAYDNYVNSFKGVFNL